jgi:hypothetical protein
MTSHANRGVEWQRILEGWHDTYRRDRRAVVWPTPPRVRVLSRVSPAGQFRAAWAAEGPPDYAGVLEPRGRAVVFDAKDCQAERWPLSSLERHQARDLEAVHAAGGFAFVALRFAGHLGAGTPRRVEGPRGDEAWVLPWATLGPLYWTWYDGDAERGQASISRARVSNLGWRMPEIGDWLGACP